MLCIWLFWQLIMNFQMIISQASFLAHLPPYGDLSSIFSWIYHPWLVVEQPNKICQPTAHPWELLKLMSPQLSNQFQLPIIDFENKTNNPPLFMAMDTILRIWEGKYQPATWSSISVIPTNPHLGFLGECISAPKTGRQILLSSCHVCVCIHDNLNRIHQVLLLVHEPRTPKDTMRCILPSSSVHLQRNMTTFRTSNICVTDNWLQT